VDGLAQRSERPGQGPRLYAAFLCAALCAALWAAQPAFADEPGSTEEPPATYFRIGTGLAGGDYFSLGGMVADAVTFRPAGKDCDTGGCGVPGLIAVAQTTQGSPENADAVEAGQLESGIIQADVAYWRYAGQWVYAGRKPAGHLRVIANLFTETIQLVTRRDSGIHSVNDLKGKRVSVGEMDSGTNLDAKVVLGGFGLTEKDVIARHIPVIAAAELLRAGKLDAFFLVSGAPAASIAKLAEMTAGGDSAVTLVPIAGDGAARIRKTYPFYFETIVPGGVYRGIEPTTTLGLYAQWVTSENLDSGLIYEITRALWNKSARALLNSGVPEGREIRVDHALDGVLLPIHPGAARYYREAGILH
jgi:TRAP transporter TAXI family solute receptor